MARAPKGKTGKASVAAASSLQSQSQSQSQSQQSKRRKKKPGTASSSYEHPPPAMRRSASASSSASSGASSPKGDGPGPTATATGSGANTPSAHGKECDQCGNCMMLDGVTASRVWPAGKKSTVSTGCQICDFVAFRKSQRPCVHCTRSGCDYFCDWCGHGFHAKCAKLRDENVGSPDGFCCRKCEAEQENPGDTSASEDDGEEDELGARCGSCHLPFNGAAPVAKSQNDSKPAGPSGFRVNQSVLVDNEDMLYNAVITAVDAKGERIKIHFIRWSKSFDDWYAMDDERINESLACDCCNQWFHIGCLPPIKSSGRWKESTYVCPTCIEDARAFHNGNRAVLKAKAAYISTSVAIANTSSNSGVKTSCKTAPSASTEDASADAAASKAFSKAKKSGARPDRDDNSASTTTDVGDKTARATASAPAANKRKRKLSEASASESPSKKKESAPAVTKRASSSSSTSPPTVVTETSEADASASKIASDVDATVANAARSDAATEPTSKDRPAAEDKNSATEAAPAGKDAPAPSPRAASKNTSDAVPDQAQASPEPATAKTTKEAHSSPSKDAADKPPSTPSNKPAAASPPTTVSATSNEQTPVAPAKQEDAKTSTTTEETHRRRGSGHSMSSLLNSPAPDEERPQPPFKPTVTSLPMIIPHRPSHETIKMMVAASLPPPAGRDPPVKVERDLFPPAPRGKSVAKKEPSTRNRSNKKSAANARGSLSAFDILREVATQSMSGDIADAPPAAKPKRERPTAQVESASNKRVKMDAATSTSSPAQAPAPAPGSDADRLAHATRERIQMNSFVDLHFNIRKEMYLRFCRLEEEGLLTRDMAHLLRALIYPTSDKFQDLKFVYLVNKDLPSDQLTKRLLEVVPATAGGKGPAALAASLLPPPPPSAHHPHPRVVGPPLSSMSLFSAGVNRNVSPAGTPRMGLLPHGSSLTDRLAESAIRSPLRSTVVSGPAPIPGSIKSDANKEVHVNVGAPGKRPDILMMERQAQARAPPTSVPNQARAGAQLISR